MEAPQAKAKPAKPAAKQEEQQQPQQQQQQQQPASLDKESSHEGFVDHAGDSLDDAAAAGEIKHDCPGVNEYVFCRVLAVATAILSKPTQTPLTNHTCVLKQGSCAVLRHRHHISCLLKPAASLSSDPLLHLAAYLSVHPEDQLCCRWYQ